MMWRWVCSIFAWKTPAQRRRERQQQLELVRRSLERSRQLARVRAASRADHELARERARARVESAEHTGVAPRRMRVADGGD